MASNQAGRRPRRKERKNVGHGMAHIKSSFNNANSTIANRVLVSDFSHIFEIKIQN